MNPEHYKRVREVFLQAREAAAPDREALLDQLCDGDVSLRSEVESLLENIDDADSFLRDPALGPSFAINQPSHLDAEAGLPETSCGTGKLSETQATREDSLPDRIGRYRIRSRIGQGGMGVVYQAEQERPRRVVALKVIRPGIASESLLRRFELEAQVLGRLQHPGIAQIFEAGTADTGFGPQPFFAMEYVEGVSLTGYAVREKLGVDARLRLIARTCEAVQHAHQKGIIHRDLKPANILVDKAGQPKVLDFGVARATDSDLCVTTVQTSTGQLIGTLQYMSPEQVTGDPNEVDTRSDVYALGVIAYELLSGRLPRDVKGKTVAEAVRIIGESRVSGVGSCNTSLRGDIETILAKALEHEKDRRYASASDFAADIRRYLNNEPIAARPATVAYQLRKFTRRNRVLVLGVVATFVALVSGIIGTSAGMVRARSAESLAREQLAEARYQAGKAQASHDFLTNMLASPDPRNDGRDVKIVDVLDRSRELLDKLPEDQPEVKASVLHAIGVTYRGLGLFEEARSMLEEALAVSSAAGMSQHKDFATTLNVLGIVLTEQGEYERAAELYERAQNIFTTQSGSDSVDCLQVMINQAALVQRSGTWEESEPLFKELVRVSRSAGHVKDELAATILNNYALALRGAGRFEEAEANFRAVLNIQKNVSGPAHPGTLTTISNLATVLADRNQMDEAISLHRQVLSGRVNAFGAQHHEAANAMNNLGEVLARAGQSREAADHMREAMEILEDLFGENDPRTVTTISNLAKIYRDIGEVAEAEILTRKAVRLAGEQFGLDHPNTLITQNNLGGWLRSIDRFEEAEATLRDLAERGQRSLPEEHWLIGVFQLSHGQSLVDLRRFDEAEPILLDAHRVMDSTFGPDHPNFQATARALARLYVDWGYPEKSAPFLAASKGSDGGE